VPRLEPALRTARTPFDQPRALPDRAPGTTTRILTTAKCFNYLLPFRVAWRRQLSPTLPPIHFSSPPTPPQTPPPNISPPPLSSPSPSCSPAIAQTTLAIQGPAENITNTVFQNRDAQKNTGWEIPVRFQITAVQEDSPSWRPAMKRTATNHWLLTISHSANQQTLRLVKAASSHLTGNETAIPVRRIGLLIADFWPGVSFLAGQKILKKNSTTTGLRRAGKHHPHRHEWLCALVSWIDEEMERYPRPKPTIDQTNC